MPLTFIVASLTAFTKTTLHLYKVAINGSEVMRG